MRNQRRFFIVQNRRSNVRGTEYFNKLQSLRDTYLERGSEDWTAATKEITELASSICKSTEKDFTVSAEKILADADKIGDSIADTAESTADKIKNALSDVKTAYQQTLDAIDAELEKHSREKQDEEYQSKIDALNARLKYEQLDLFSRRDLEQELADVQAEWDEVKYQRDAVDAKSLLETVYTQAQDMINVTPVDVDTDQWNAAILSAFENVGSGFVSGVEREMPTTSSVYNIVVNAGSKTTDQIVREVKNAIASGAI